MKKLLALGLSMAMMASLSAVAFAAGEQTVTKDDLDPTDHDATKTVVVQTKLKETPSDDDTFTVTIPATPQTIEWNASDVNVDLNVKIKGQMLEDSSVNVKASKLSELKNGNESLQVTMAQDLNFTATGKELKNEPSSTGFNITAVDWNSTNVIGVYSNTVTYTVTYTAGTTTSSSVGE